MNRYKFAWLTRLLSEYLREWFEDGGWITGKDVVDELANSALHWNKYAYAIKECRHIGEISIKSLIPSVEKMIELVDTFLDVESLPEELASNWNKYEEFVELQK